MAGARTIFSSITSLLKRNGRRRQVREDTHHKWPKIGHRSRDLRDCHPCWLQSRLWPVVRNCDHYPLAPICGQTRPLLLPDTWHMTKVYCLGIKPPQHSPQPNGRKKISRVPLLCMIINGELLSLFIVFLQRDVGKGIITLSAKSDVYCCMRIAETLCPLLPVGARELGPMACRR